MFQQLTPSVNRPLRQEYFVGADWAGRSRCKQRYDQMYVYAEENIGTFDAPSAF